MNEESEGIVKELRNGSNWLIGRNNVYSYNKAPKQAADLINVLSEISIPDLIVKLRSSESWKIEGHGHWKDCTTTKSDAPLRAADLLEMLWLRIRDGEIK